MNEIPDMVQTIFVDRCLVVVWIRVYWFWSRSERDGNGGRILVASVLGRHLHMRRVSHVGVACRRQEWEGDALVHRDKVTTGRYVAIPTAVRFLKRLGRTELSQAILDRERSCHRFSGLFGVPAWCSTRSRRVAWSGGKVVPCVGCMFFVKSFRLRRRRTLLSRPGCDRPTRRDKISYCDMSWRRDQKAALTSVAITAEGSALHAFGDLVIRISAFDMNGFGEWCIGTHNALLWWFVGLHNSLALLVVVERQLDLTSVTARLRVAVPRDGRYLYPLWVLVSRGTLSTTLFSVVVRRLFQNASSIGSPRFCVSQAPVCAWGLSRYSDTVEVLSSSWTPSLSGRVVVRLRERRQGTATCCGGSVGLHSSLSLLVVVERQLDLTSVTGRLRGSSCAVLSGLDTDVMNQKSVPCGSIVLSGSCFATSCCGGLVGLHSSLALLVVVERQLDLTSVTARLRGSSCAVLSGVGTDVVVVSERRLTGCGLTGYGVPWWWHSCICVSVVVPRDGSRAPPCARPAHPAAPSRGPSQPPRPSFVLVGPSRAPAPCRVAPAPHHIVHLRGPPPQPPATPPKSPHGPHDTNRLLPATPQELVASSCGLRMAPFAGLCIGCRSTDYSHRLRHFSAASSLRSSCQSHP
ncbi:hypothetical protein Taro_004178 [Colocasia esculenta]|uniref:Uncharacterized protein n=1 Tax=Colocasia esculenta TaxID=4460 RepID=A0A843TQV6_COLES|nr:hypothetical protein [Colocasia esculenta]